MKFFSSCEFNCDVSQVKWVVQIELVLIIDCGQFIYVLMSIVDYCCLIGESESILELLVMFDVVVLDVVDVVVDVVWEYCELLI